MPDSRNAPDIIDQQIIARSLQSVAEEMGINLLRNAFSSVVREAKDMSTAVFDRDGALVAQADHIPMLISAMTTAIETCLTTHGDDIIGPDTVLITNDPYRGCQHLNDIAIFMPVFADGERIAWVGTIAHHLDVGGVAPGMLPSASEIWEEGIVIPPLCLALEDGRFPPLFTDLLLANVRAPEDTMGDLNAQLAALLSGRRRVEAIAAKYGVGMLCAVMAALLEASERTMAAVLGALPDFAIEGSSQLDDDGIGGGPMTVRVRAEKRGSRLAIDFTGSSPQRPCMMNANRSSTLGACWTVFRHVFGAGVPIWFNAGALRGLSVEIPEGCFLNARPPASVHARIITAYRVYDALMDAFAKVVPERASATGFNSSICLALSHLDQGQFRIFVEVLSGGWGARAGSDGPDALPFPLSNCSNAPAEYVEAQFPFLRIRRYGLYEGSAGAGRQRGGLGEIRDYDILADDVFLTVFSDRFKHGAPGLLGGEPGKPGAIEVHRAGQVLAFPSKTGIALERGDRLRILGGGGGGYGHPAERSPEAIRQDERDGLVTVG
ncbi:MAG: hydantoinase B/oxoprolinase family protein [Pseudomonadota bacterium]